MMHWLSQLGRASRVVFLALGAALAAGCALTAGGPQTPEEIVLARAQARWNALVRRDWREAYSYLVPSYRAVVPLDRYGNQFSGPVQWEGAKAQSASCEEKRCTVKVEIIFRAILPGHSDRVSSTFMDEVWVLDGGKWFKFETL